MKTTRCRDDSSVAARHKTSEYVRHVSSSGEKLWDGHKYTNKTTLIKITCV